MSQRFKEYTDEYKNLHIQDKVLGQGGQGMVFRTKDPDIAIKLVTDESGTPVSDEDSVKRYSKRFRRVRLLPLPESLNISVPVALLQNNAGYVMQLLSEMVPFSNFWLDGKAAEKITAEDIPAWLIDSDSKSKAVELEERIESLCTERASEQEKDRQKELDRSINQKRDKYKDLTFEVKKIVHYHKTGGLRRRLIALYKCASLLARLHGNGLVYGDISPNNIFISEGLEDSSVWLIDADNIRFEITAGGSVVYTPKYGAPELVQGKDGGRPASDCYSFAVVAFYLLSLIHPFIGRKVDGTDEGDWADDENDDEDIEEKAYAGFVPWVDDQSDDLNSSDSGLPRSLLLTEKLKILFETTFGPGRISPLLRPTIYHWPEAFAQASDMTVSCLGCSMNYYYDFIHPETDSHNCPYCKTRRSQVLILESYRWNGANRQLNSPCWRYSREITNNSELTIPRRVFDDFTMVDSDTAEAFISLTEKDILIKKSDHSKTDLSVAAESNPQNGFQKIYSQLKIDRNSSELRFWMFAHLNSPRLILCSISGGGI